MHHENDTRYPVEILAEELPGDQEWARKLCHNLELLQKKVDSLESQVASLQHQFQGVSIREEALVRAAGGSLEVPGE